MNAAYLSKSCIHCSLSCACSNHFGLQVCSSSAKKATMSWSHCFLGLAWARPRGQLEWSRGCQRLAVVLHLCTSVVASLLAHLHCLRLQMSSHSLWPALASCSSVQRAVRFINSAQGSMMSTSVSPSVAELSLEVGSSFHLFAFNINRSIFL